MKGFYPLKGARRNIGGQEDIDYRANQSRSNTRFERGEREGSQRSFACGKLGTNASKRVVLTRKNYKLLIAVKQSQPE